MFDYDYGPMFQNYDWNSAHSLITRPLSKTSIDQVLSNFADKIYVDLVECNLSDHNMVYYRFNSNVVNRQYTARTILRNRLSENYSSIDPSELTNILISGMKHAINEIRVNTMD